MEGNIYKGCDNLETLKKIEVVAYNPQWAAEFDRLASQLRRIIGEIKVTIHHVGSTSVPGLVAKAILDVDLVYYRLSDFSLIKDRLEAQGLVHQGDLGIPGREVFKGQEVFVDHMPFHLYVCHEEAKELKRHLRFKKALIAHESWRQAYGDLKKELAEEFEEDRLAYTEGKTDFIDGILLKSWREEITGRFLMPERLRQLLIQSDWEKVPYGKSGMDVFLIMPKKQPYLLLKISEQTDGMQELAYESDVLSILEPYDLAPRLYFTDIDDTMALSLREYIKGRTIPDLNLPLEKKMAMCGQFLKQIHQVMMTNVVLHSYEDRLASAAKRLLMGLVDEEDFEEDNRGVTGASLYDRLIKTQPLAYEAVLTHGDYTPANIICADSGMLKCIDWGRAAMMDPYADLALFLRDLRDLDPEEKAAAQTAFLKAYGLDVADPRRIDYYILLDEFF